MTVTKTREVTKPRGPRIRGISADAVALDVTREHLNLVLRGKRQSDGLKRRYQALKKLQKEKNIDTTPATLAEALQDAKNPMPIELAALQNLQPFFFKTLTELNLNMVIVRFEAGKDSAIWYHDKIANELEAELQAINPQNGYDSSFFPLGAQWHFFHIKHATFGAAMHRLKDALAARGLLEISGIYHAESAEYLTEWYPGTAAGINVPIETE